MSVPQIRFKGFADAWEQRKLGEVAEHFEYGLNASAKDFDGNHKYIRITDIDDNLRVFDESGLTSPDIDFDDADSYLLKQGDILFARTGASVGKSYIHRNDNDLVYFAGFLIRTRLLDDYSSEFIFQNTLTEKYNAFIKIMSQRSGQPGVNAQEYASYFLSIPTFEEQTAIGSFFRTLDTTINLHKRKLDSLRELKKAYLQVMFSQSGESVPRVRFAGFSGDWVERKLGEVAKTYSGGTPPVGIKEYYNGEIPFIRSAEINSVKTELFLTEKGLKNSSAKTVEIGTILYALYGATSGEVGISRINGAINQAILAIKPMQHYDRNFIFQYLRREKNSIISTYLQGGQGNLSGAIIKDLTFSSPVLAEQQQIGNFFRNLDEQITAQQVKLEGLKRLKAGYLQKMLV